MNASQDFCHIFVHQFAVICSKYIIGTSFFVQSQCQWTVLICIPKGKLHLVTVCKFNRTSMDSFPLVLCTV